MSTAVLIGKSGPFRIMWPAIAEPKVFKGKDGRASAPHYEATLLIPNDHPDLAVIKLAIKTAMQEKGLRPGVRVPITDGATEAERQAEARKARGKEPYDNSILNGHQLLRVRATESRPPEVFDARNRSIKPVKIDRADKEALRRLVYSGAFVAAAVNFTGYTGMGGGVTAYLNSLAVVADGKRFGGVDYSEVWSGITGRPEAEDMTDGMDLTF